MIKKIAVLCILLLCVSVAYAQNLPPTKTLTSLDKYSLIDNAVLLNAGFCNIKTTECSSKEFSKSSLTYNEQALFLQSFNKGFTSSYKQKPSLKTQEDQAQRSNIITKEYLEKYGNVCEKNFSNKVVANMCIYDTAMDYFYLHGVLYGLWYNDHKINLDQSPTFIVDANMFLTVQYSYDEQMACLNGSKNDKTKCGVEPFLVYNSYKLGFGKGLPIENEQISKGIQKSYPYFLKTILPQCKIYKTTEAVILCASDSYVHFFYQNGVDLRKVVDAVLIESSKRKN